MNILKTIQFTSKILTIAPKLLNDTLNSCLRASCFSTLNARVISPELLRPNVPSILPSCGLKIKGKMRLRCKHCYFVRREGRMYVMCKSFPRHKQTHLVPREKYTWILTHACQSKLRPY